MAHALEKRANLAGRRAVVVGGAVGIGRGVSLALAEAGVDVAFCDLDEAAILATSTEITALGLRALGVVADATVPEQLRAFYEQVETFFAGIEVVVNIVGGVLMAPLMDKSPASCADDIQRNFGYVIESTRHAVPLLRRRHRSAACIINFTSIEAHRGAGGFAVYAGAKAATTNFSKAMAWELGPEGIRVNVIAPDTTDSAGNRKAMPESVQAMNAAVPFEWWAKAFEMYIPLSVPPTTDDLANAVLFLASDLARSITGQVLHVDGGTGTALGMMRWPEDGGITLPVPAGNTLKKLFG